MNRKRFISTMGLGASSLLASGCPRGGQASGLLPDFDSDIPAPFWNAIRKAYPLGTERVYLNCGGLGPAPSVVLDAVRAKADELQYISETGYALMDQARAVAARFFGADMDEICFTRNATESNSIIAAGLKLRKGDEVIFESHAHPGGSFPWLNRQKRHGIKVRIFDPDPNSMAGSLDRIRELDRKSVV